MIVSIHDISTVRYLQKGLNLTGLLMGSIAAFRHSYAIEDIAEWERIRPAAVAVPVPPPLPDLYVAPLDTFDGDTEIRDVTLFGYAQRHPWRKR